ncbi:unnamed protein product [Notodromas monacha]|uniref:Hexosyltransferase n=1 Tax=Notodromas monacha TaxID=399045 RepID=A0A7R9BCJ2_9CRUS|nr:unnamed protein product [Notodromas monacha]CAG0912823.1 unnamed protein product [Notodromas monacha]
MAYSASSLSMKFDFLRYHSCGMIRLKTRKKWWKSLVILVLCLFALDYFFNIFGVFLILRSTKFDASIYPVEGDIVPLMRSVWRGEKPVVSPVVHPKVTLLREPVCPSAEIRLLIVIKSASEHSDRREVIRRTWGFEKRFSDVEIRTIFAVGSSSNIYVRNAVDKEADEFRDLLYADFVDTYYNNTLKTLTGIRWAANACPSEYVLFVDDDYYVSVKNLLSFLRHPDEYPEGAIREKKETLKAREAMRAVVNKNRRLSSFVESNSEESTRSGSLGFRELNSRNLLLASDLIAKQSVEDSRSIALSENIFLSEGFYVGYLFSDSVPKRSVWNKWYVSLEEYPFYSFPTYITAGAILMDHATVVRMHLGTLFTKLFRFDDPYLGIVAKKAKVMPRHSDYFLFDRHSFYDLLFGVRFEHVIASHGYGEGKDLIRTWEEAKKNGHA